MMKNIIYIFGFWLLVSCSSSLEKAISESDTKISTENDSIRINETFFDLNGTWGLTNYFDTICDYKELARYRLQAPTWFAILLEIENDSLKNFGSIENAEYFIDKTNDTLATLTSEISGGKWYLIVNEPNLELIQDSNSESIDSMVYIFRKREDLNYFARENKDFFIIGNNVTDYFNDQLFKGKYTNIETRQEVVFGDNRQLVGIDGFDSYEVRNYFGTLHMHKNLDVITFINKENNESKQFNWVFSGDELLLTEFVHEKVTSKGKIYDGDYLILGKEKIKLKKH